MHRWFSLVALLCVVGGGLVAVPHASAVPAIPAPPATSPGSTPSGSLVSSQPATNQAAATFGGLPLRFEVNQGQADPAARFVVRAAGAVVYLTARDALFTFAAPGSNVAPAGGAGGQPPADSGGPPAVVRLGLSGADPNPRVSGVNPLPGVSNYLIGKDPARWHTNVASFAGVRYSGVYPGVDLVYHGGSGGLEYDFEVAPGADASKVSMVAQGGDRPTVDSSGDLVVNVGGAEFRQHGPDVYQEVDGVRRAVAGRFSVNSDDSVGFVLGGYDHRLPLVIDPVVVYSTYLGRSGDNTITGVALDSSNNAYLTGSTDATDFPVAGAFQATCNKCKKNAKKVAFVTKLNATGTALVYSTYLGGTNGWEDQTESFGLPGIAVDSAGAAYVTGSSNSTDFPTTAGGYKTFCGGSGSGQCSSTPAASSPNDAFLVKLAPTGSAMAYGTYLGGSGDDYGTGIALGAAGVVYVSGDTLSSDLVTTANAYQLASGGPADAFMVKIDTAASGVSSLLYATYLGGGNADDAMTMAVDPASPDIAYVAGLTQSTNFPTKNPVQGTINGANTSGFLAKLDTTLGTSGLLFSTYFGPSASGSYFPGTKAEFSGMAVKNAVAYLVGATNASSYPTNGANPAYQPTFQGPGPNAFDAVVTDIDTTGAGSLVYSTFLGNGLAEGVAVEPGGKLVVAGEGSGSFPSVHPIQATVNGPFAARLDPSAGTTGLAYSTGLGQGGQGSAVAVDGTAKSNAYFAGFTSDSSFPTTAGAFDTTGPRLGTDGFVTKLDATAGDQAVVTALGRVAGPFTGGTTVVLTGIGFIGATAVNFGSVPAASFRVDSNSQITAVSPCAASGNPTSCPESVLASVSASQVNVTVTSSSGVVSSPGAGNLFSYGEGGVADTASCSACLPGGEMVALNTGKVLYETTTADHYGDGSATTAATGNFTSAGQRSFTSADVGKRIDATQITKGVGVMAQDTTITAVLNATTVTVSPAPLKADTTATLSFAVSRNDSEIYDPVGDTWTDLTGLNQACNQCGGLSYLPSLTVLANGKVLHTGGTDPVYHTLTAVKEASIFDPASNTWASAGAMSRVRKDHTATLLVNGNVLVAGGANLGLDTGSPQPTDPTATADVYNPSTNTWAATGAMATARANAAAALLPSGKVLVAGGLSSVQTATDGMLALASAEQYDPTSGTWAPAGSMSTARYEHGIALLGSAGACGPDCGNVLVVGGKSCYNDCPPAAPAQGANQSAELYTPGTPGSWAYTAPLSAPHVQNLSQTLASALPNGHVAVGPGLFGVAGERFDPATGVWLSAGQGGGGILLAPGPASGCGTRCGQVLMDWGRQGLYVPRPTVSAVSPASAAAGSTVSVRGSGLASVTSVSFGGAAATNVAHDQASPDSVLTVSVPASSGAVDVTVSGPGGVSAVNAGDRFGVAANVVANFRGDGRTDVSVFRSSSGTWFVQNGVAVNYGTSGDVAVPADFDGDGATDIAVFRPSTGTWFMRSGAGVDSEITYGVSSDVPVPADYDGVGRAEVAVFRPSTGAWYVHNPATGADSVVTFGIAGDIPVPGDYDGVGHAEMAVFRPSSGTWFVRNPTTGAFSAVNYGQNGDVPVPGDFAGVGRVGYGVFRPSTGTWFTHNPASGVDTLITYGIGSDVPVPGDYDGVGRAEVAVFRPSTAAWYVHNPATGADTVTTFGIGGDTPLPPPNAIRRFYG